MSIMDAAMIRLSKLCSQPALPRDASRCRVIGLVAALAFVGGCSHGAAISAWQAKAQPLLLNEAGDPIGLRAAHCTASADLQRPGRIVVIHNGPRDARTVGVFLKTCQMDGASWHVFLVGESRWRASPTQRYREPKFESFRLAAARVQDGRLLWKMTDPPTAAPNQDGIAAHCLFPGAVDQYQVDVQSDRIVVTDSAAASSWTLDLGR